jgi:hypothetical protein
VAINVFEGKPYYQVAMLNADGDTMETVLITGGAVVNDSTIQQVCSGLIGIDHQVEGFVTGPCTSLWIQKVQDTVTTVGPPPAEPAA